MIAQGQLVFDVVDFEEDVIARSAEVPVLVDFWGEWCAPCVALGRTLETFAEEFDGAFVLAKVNTATNQEVAARYDVSSLPDIKLFRDGKVVGGLVGTPPKKRLRAFLTEHCRPK